MLESTESRGYIRYDWTTAWVRFGEWRGPHAFYHDLSLSKSLTVHENMKFRLQSEFMNVWNHPVFASVPGYTMVSSSVQATGFALGTVSNSPRHIEIRANFEF